MTLFQAIALSFLNIPYIYGGKTPLVGMDCSALACEILQATGALETNTELSSQQLFDLFRNDQFEGALKEGDLAFYGQGSSQISHVAVFLDNNLIIEAGHGNSQITTIVMAQNRDAKTRVRPHNYRKDLVAVVRPNYKKT